MVFAHISLWFRKQSRSWSWRAIEGQSVSSKCPSGVRAQVSKQSVVCLTCFIRRGTQNTNSKEHYMCIKEKQYISSQSFCRNLSHLYTPFRYLWHFLKKIREAVSIPFLKQPNVGYRTRWWYTRNRQEKYSVQVEFNEKLLLVPTKRNKYRSL